MSAMQPIGPTIRRPARRDRPRVHPSWLETPETGDPARRLDEPTMRQLWDAIDRE